MAQIQFALSCSPELMAEQDQSPRRFSGTCYSGGVIPNYGWYGDAVIDLSTLKAPTKPIFALVNHDKNQRAGRLTIGSDGTRVWITDGSFLPSASGKQVSEEFAAGAPWEFSVGINADVRSFDKPTQVEVNGQTVTVDTVFSNARVREVSFVTAGADPHTEAIAFAQQELDMQEVLAELKAQLEAERALSVGRKAELDAAKADIEEMKLAFDTASAELDKTLAELKAMRAAKRVADVRALFADVGREFSDESAAKYADLPEAHFAFVAAELRETVSKSFDEKLLGEVATKGKDVGSPSAKIDMEVKRAMEADPKLTRERAMANVLLAQPNLYIDIMGASH